MHGPSWAGFRCRQAGCSWRVVLGVILLHQTVLLPLVGIECAELSNAAKRIRENWGEFYNFLDERSGNLSQVQACWEVDSSSPSVEDYPGAPSGSKEMLCVPDFFLVGVQKSGTSALWKMILQHPQVADDACNVPKEPHFFDRDGVTREAVLEYLRRNAQAKLCGERSLPGCDRWDLLAAQPQASDGASSQEDDGGVPGSDEAWQRRCRVLLGDGTVEYSDRVMGLNEGASLSARVALFRQMAPHARVLMIVREPGERALSEWHDICEHYDDSRCTEPAEAGVVELNRGGCLCPMSPEMFHVTVAHGVLLLRGCIALRGLHQCATQPWAAWDKPLRMALCKALCEEFPFSCHAEAFARAADGCPEFAVLGFHMLRHGFYDEYRRAWTNERAGAFPPSQFLLVAKEHLEDQPASLARPLVDALLRHLGLTPARDERWARQMMRVLADKSGVHKHPPMLPETRQLLDELYGGQNGRLLYSGTMMAPLLRGKGG
eukprot:jgi/Mesvir1/10543/Mv21775-RA.1